MSDEKKKPESDVTEQKETPAPEEKPVESPQSEEKAEGQEVVEQAEEVPEETSEGETEDITAPPEMSEIDKLKEENFRLKTQITARDIGFMPEVIEDAVILAENIVKRDGTDISAALQAVAKKYPDWKADGKDKGKAKGGFKVGADSSGQASANDDKINKAFGLKKKG